MSGDTRKHSVDVATSPVFDSARVYDVRDAAMKKLDIKETKTLISIRAWNVSRLDQNDRLVTSVLRGRRMNMSGEGQLYLLTGQAAGQQMTTTSTPNELRR